MSMKDAEGKSTFSALKQVVAQLPVAVLVFDLRGHLLSANKTVGTLTGYPEEELFHVAPPVISETFTAEELSKTYTILLRYPEQPVTVSSSLVHKDGSKLACRLRFSLLQENQDRCILVTISREKQENNGRIKVHQPTERNAVPKTEAVSALLEQITDGFTAYDKNWNYTYVNQRAAAIANRTPADLLGKNLWREFPELVGTSLYHTYHKAVKEQVVIRTEEYVALFQKWFEGVLYPSADGLSVFFQDITEKKKAERTLKEQELLYRTIVETSQEGIWQVDAENRTTFVNSFMQTLLGYTKEEMTGRPFLDFMTEDAKPLALTMVERRKNGLAEQHEFTFLRKDGRLLPTLVQSTPIIQNGQYAGAVAMVLDNTKRKKAEEQLRESEAKYRKAQAQGKLGHWEWAALTNQLTLSDEIYAMFALDPDTHLPDYEKFLNSLYTDDRPAVENKISQAFAGGTGYDLFCRIVLEDGSLRHVHMIAEPVKNTSGELVKMVGMVQDITAQKQIEQELSLSEQNYRLLFEKSPVPFWMLDYPSFNFIEVNQAATDLYGYTREEFLTMTVRDIRLDNAESYFTYINESIAEGETKKSIAQHRKKSGEILFVQLAFTLITYNGKMVRLASTRDITQEMQYANRLQEKEQQLSLIFNSVNSGMALFKVEPDGKLRYEAMNDALCKAIRIRPEEVVGRTLLDVFGFEDVRHLLPGYGDAIATGEIQKFTAQSSQRIGNRLVEYTAIPIKDESGAVVQLLNVSNDVTEKIKAEHELLRINQELRQLSSHLENVREEERTMIAREIHDELGQQLTGLKMEISWIRRHLQQHDENIKTRIQASLHLIDDTINAVRRIASRLRPSLLDDLGLAEAMDWHRQEFSRQTGLQVSFFSNVKEIKFSPPLSIAVFRIFQEALTNVARHAKATMVTCSLQQKDNRLFLTITDDGMGFTWQPKREHKTLGLLGMKERVAVLNGHFAIETHPGKGTVISVTIPVDE